MKPLIHFSLSEIEEKLQKNEFPFSGITLSGCAEFHFMEPSFYAGVALHAGNRVRESLATVMSASVEERLREEDPYTELFLKEIPIQIIARDSRFEYDLNRETYRAIYSHDSKTWGIQVWKKELNKKERNQSLAKHREFHELVDLVAEYLLHQGNYALLFDMHSYGYQRERTMLWYQDPDPEINLGTKAINRDLFGDITDDFKCLLSGLVIDGHPVRVAENKVFGGGYLARRLSKTCPDRLLVLALEYKKIFMNEITGELYEDKLTVLIEHFNQAVEKLTHSGFFGTPKDG